MQQRWLRSRRFAVATAIALQVWPRHRRNHLVRSQNGFGSGTLWLDDREHGIDSGKRRLKSLSYYAKKMLTGVRHENESCRSSIRVSGLTDFQMGCMQKISVWCYIKYKIL